MATQSGKFLLRLASPLIRERASPPKLGGLGRAHYHACLRVTGTFFPEPSFPANTQHVRYFSTSGNSGDGSGSETSKKPQVVLQKLGDFPYGSREYRLVVQQLPPQQQQATATTTISDDSDDTGNSDPTIQAVASLRAHRNILFGARLLGSTAQKRALSEVCGPLLDAALEDAGVEGDQPQAMATLHGLCDWVTECLEDDDKNGNPTSSKALQKIKSEYNDDLLAYHAIRAMATGIPREGHSVVGQGTFRDGEQGWEALAQEFMEQKLAEEVELYRSRGATVVAVEHLADTKPEYLRSAGGAMARLFFL